MKNFISIVDNRRPNNLVSMFERSKSYQDEDPYSLPANSSSSSGGSGGNSTYGQKQSSSRPPKLPPRDVFGKKPPVNLPKPDYEDDSENNYLVEQKPKNDSNNKFGN